MRNRLYGGLAVLLGLCATAASVNAQTGLGQGGLSDSYGLPGLPSFDNPITAPLGNPGGKGFYTFGQMYWLGTDWTLGKQVVAVRGFRDSQGAITGALSLTDSNPQPGAFIGSGEVALTTNQFGRRTFSPGVELGFGYKVEDGTSVYVRFLALSKEKYNAGASLVPDFARTGVQPNLAETFLFSPVYNFNPAFAGPDRKTAFDGALLPGTPGVIADRILPTGLLYGIWNGASNMTLSYERSYNEGEIAARVPLFQSETSRIYGVAGGRYHFFMERFRWLTTSYDVDGFARPRDTAVYDNSLSQRLYGPYVGCGHEVYMGQNFSLAGEIDGAVLLSLVKERAKYRLSDRSISNKRSHNQFDAVPYLGGNLNVNWFPLSGVQMRIGYSAQTFYNTRAIDQPIGFNYGAIDPSYEYKAFRIIHGVNFGFGLFF